jgi:hypothetical protein
MPVPMARQETASQVMSSVSRSRARVDVAGDVDQRPLVGLPTYCISTLR